MTSPSPKKNLELMSPVANLAMCQAAVHNGAHAIYVGMPGFNARGRTADLSLEELTEIIDYCHLYGVKVFIAFNILIFEPELAIAAACLNDVIKLGIDAFIVQDLGLARLIKQIAPTQVIHASTQMTVSNAQAIELTQDLQLERYVLARENSLADMKDIRAATNKELEVFVHGALCVAYSGQCLTSERMGGRSANRGQCAQSCRLPYELIVDGEVKDLGDQRYLVSPKDHCGVHDVQALQSIGIDSLKIEGRLKSPEYVAVTAKHYRQAIDNAESVNDQASTDHSSQDMALNYSRGFINGWFDGVRHQDLVDGRFSDHRGLQLGQLKQIEGTVLIISANEALTPGDGILFADDKNEILVGGRLYQAKEVTTKNNQTQWRLGFGNDFAIDRLRPGMTAYLNDKPQRDKTLQQTWQNRLEQKRTPIHAQLSGRPGAVLTLTLTDNDGNQASVNSDATLDEAKSRPVEAAWLEEKLAVLEHSCYSLASVNIDVASNSFVQEKMLRKLKQAAIAALNEARINRDITPQTETSITNTWLKDTCKTASENNSTTETQATSSTLSVLIREPEQLSAFETLTPEGLDMVILDFEHGQKYKRYCDMVRHHGLKVGIATTRVLKPSEIKHLDAILALQPDAILVRNLGAQHYLHNRLNSLNAQQRPTLIGDFSLNTTNHLSATYLMDKHFDRLCPSYDLNKQQLGELIRSSPSTINWEVTLHQYMPEFHMEHCVFARFMSDGNSYKDCGAPCEQHRVELRAHKGEVHPLKADMECRNTVFNGTPQSAGRLVPDLQAKGVRHFRLEALYETPEELYEKTETYAKLLRGDISADDAFDQLAIVEKYGVSEGQLQNTGTYQDRKK